MTLILLVIIDYIPGLSLRASEEAEIIGIDEGRSIVAGQVAFH